MSHLNEADSYKVCDQEERVITAARVGEPSMNGEVLTQTMNDLISGVAGTQSQL